MALLPLNRGDITHRQGATATALLPWRHRFITRRHFITAALPRFCCPSLAASSRAAIAPSHSYCRFSTVLLPHHRRVMSVITRRHFLTATALLPLRHCVITRRNCSANKALLPPATASSRAALFLPPLLHTLFTTPLLGYYIKQRTCIKVHWCLRTRE